MYIDIVISLLLIFAIYRGWKNGFVMELFSFLSLFVGVYVAIHFSDWLTVYLRDQQEFKSEYLPIVSFVLLLLVVIVAIYFLGKLLTATLKAGGMETINKLSGAAFSLAKAVLGLSLFFILFHSFDSKANILPEKQKEESILYSHIYHFSLNILPSLKESEFYQAVANYSHGEDAGTEKNEQ